MATKLNAATRLRAASAPTLSTLISWISAAFEREFDQDIEVNYARVVDTEATGNLVVLFSSQDAETNKWLVNRIVFKVGGAFVDMDAMPVEELPSAARAKSYINTGK